VAEKDSFDLYIHEVAAVTLKNGGSTSKPEKCEFTPVDDFWAFPLFPARTAILPASTDLGQALKQFIRANQDVLSRPDCWLGTWINTRTGEFYLDVTTRCANLEDAIRLAKEVGRLEGRPIEAIFNAFRNETIFLKE
jgi:hypothetical protein